MREIQAHPILNFKKGKEVSFFFNGNKIIAYDGENIAMALYRLGIDVFSESPKLHRPRGMFCAIGKCSSCMMRVNGIPNVRTCVLPVQENMIVETQSYYGKLPDKVENFKKSIEISKDVAIVGAGPAGATASITLKEYGINPILIEQNSLLGGQLVKQTHKFFGSEREKAGTRGIKIAEELIKQIEEMNIDALVNSTAFGFYPEENILGVFRDNQFIKISAKYYLIATGASEKMIPFPGNDLPGVFGAGAAQTIMNVFGIKPGNKILMVGAGNVGLIVSYQLLQAGVEVKAVVEAMDEIGGYFVHASKLRRFGVPILIKTTIKEAIGYPRVEKAITVNLDDSFNEIPGTEKEWDVDTICLSTGLIPSVNLLAQAGCDLKYSPYLGGYVPIRNKYLMTTKENIYVAGDVDGIEEASVAMIEGRMAALSILEKMGFNTQNKIADTLNELKSLRNGPFSKKIVQGIKEVEYE